MQKKDSKIEIKRKENQAKKRKRKIIREKEGLTC